MVPGQPGRYGLEGGVHPERGVCTIEGLSRVEKAERNVIPDALGVSHLVPQCSVEDVDRNWLEMPPNSPTRIPFVSTVVL